MEYKKHTFDTYNIHTIKSDKFKTCSMEIFFYNKVDIKDYTKRLLLFNLLFESCEYYKNFREMAIHNEELYGSSLSCTTSRVGNYVINNISIGFLNPKYTDSTMLDASISFVFDILNHPNIVNGEAEKESFNTNKNRMKLVLETEKERKRNYSINKLLSIMADGKAPGIAPSGTLESLEEITSSNIITTYNNILKHDYCDIFVYGDLDMNEVVELIKNKCLLNSIKTSDIGNIVVKIPKAKKVKKIFEKADVIQANLVHGYTLDGLTTRERQYVMPIFNVIFGDGSLDAKLYTLIREENSLCYNIQSIYLKYDSILLITTEIDKKSYGLCEKLISKCFKEMLKGNFTLEEIKNAKLMFINALESIHDSQSSTISNYFFQEINNTDSIENKIKNFKSVTKEEIVKVAAKINLHTTFLLGSGEE